MEVGDPCRSRIVEVNSLSEALGRKLNLFFVQSSSYLSVTKQWTLIIRVGDVLHIQKVLTQMWCQFKSLTRVFVWLFISFARSNFESIPIHILYTLASPGLKLTAPIAKEKLLSRLKETLLHISWASYVSNCTTLSNTWSRYRECQETWLKLDDENQDISACNLNPATRRQRDTACMSVWSTIFHNEEFTTNSHAKCFWINVCVSKTKHVLSY